MVDTVATQVLVDGERNCVLKFTNISDGTGEAAVLKVDVSALSPAPSEVKINRVQYMTHGIGVQILWDATANVQAMRLPQDEFGDIDLTRFGGVINNAGAGKTGDVLFTTTETAIAGDGYTVVLHMVKRYD